MHICSTIVHKLGFIFLQYQLIASESEKARLTQEYSQHGVARGMCSGEMQELTVSDLLHEGWRQHELCFTNRSDADVFAALLDEGVIKIHGYICSSEYEKEQIAKRNEELRLRQALSKHENKWQVALIILLVVTGFGVVGFFQACAHQDPDDPSRRIGMVLMSIGGISFIALFVVGVLYTQRSVWAKNREKALRNRVNP